MFACSCVYRYTALNEIMISGRFGQKKDIVLGSSMPNSLLHVTTVKCRRLTDELTGHVLKSDESSATGRRNEEVV